MTHKVLVACLALLLIIGTAVHADPVMLQGIPRTSWDRPYMPVSILHTALTGAGCPLSYEDLMVASGAAFSMTWRPGMFQPGTARIYQQDPIVNGGVAAGAQVERRQFQTASEAYDAAADSIDAGHPVIAYDDGRVDWQVVFGYDESTQTLRRRTLDTGEKPDLCPAESLRSPGESYGSKGPYELWLVVYDRSKAPSKLNWPLAIANALRLAQWPDADRLWGRYVCGDSAYYAWATDLRSSRLWQQWPTAGRVTWNHAWLIERSRRAAANSLQANSAVHPAFKQAAAMYGDEADLLGKVQETLCGGQKLTFYEAVKVTEDGMKDAKVRETCADLIEQALATDKAARAQLTLALKDLAPDLVPVEAAKPAP
jgi:hypothetical protein